MKFPFEIIEELEVTFLRRKDIRRNKFEKEHEDGSSKQKRYEKKPKARPNLRRFEGQTFGD